MGDAVAASVGPSSITAPSGEQLREMQTEYIL